MNSVKFHSMMTRDMRRTCRNHIELLVIEMKRVDRAMQKAEDTGQPVVALLDQFNDLRQAFCLAWVQYRRASKFAAQWASHERARLAARRGRP